MRSRPRLYFSLRSPYSWLVLHDLTTHHADLLGQLDWRPAWDPDPRSEAMLRAAGGRYLYTPMSKEKHLYSLMDVRRLARARGLRVVWPVDRAPRWEVSHLAYLIADQAGCGTDFAIAVSRARWELGWDISDPDVIVKLGEPFGLDPVRLRGAADDPALLAAGTQKLLDMYHNGVFGVPFFVHGREKFWGLDRLDAFVDSVRAARTEDGQHPEPPAAAVAMAVSMAGNDDGHAGGCG
jgi:2-hydroxychromene-2-carboxylate isomerase